MSERLVNAKEIAELLGVPETWVRETTRSGGLPHYTLGRYRRYSVPEVLEWLRTCRVEGRPVEFRAAGPVT